MFPINLKIETLYPDPIFYKHKKRRHFSPLLTDQPNMPLCIEEAFFVAAQPYSLKMVYTFSLSLLKDL